MKLSKAFLATVLGLGCLLAIPNQASAANAGDYFKTCYASATYIGYTGNTPGSGSQTFSTPVELYDSMDEYGAPGGPVVTSGTTIGTIVTWCQTKTDPVEPALVNECVSRLTGTTHSASAAHTDWAYKMYISSVSGGQYVVNTVDYSNYHSTSASCTNASGYSSVLDGDDVSVSGAYDLDWTSSSISGATYTLEKSANYSFPNPTVVYSGSNLTFSGQLTGTQIAVFFFRVKACDSSNWCSISDIHSVDNDLFEEN